METKENLGFAGKVATYFIDSKLTPLIILASLLLGIFAIVMTPREEEPQIVVPMIDLFVPYPGGTPKEVEERITKPLEKKINEIKGVEYIYSMSRPGGTLVITRFLVGQDMEQSLVKFWNKLMSNRDVLPLGAGEPIVKARTIDDVPILALTIWSDRYGPFELRRIASDVADEVKKGSDVSEVTLIGGERRQFRVALDYARMAGFRVSPLQVMGAIGKANSTIPAGRFESGNREYLIEAGEFVRSARELEGLVIGVQGGRPIYLRDVASVIDGPEEAVNYVSFGSGPAFSGHVRAGLKAAPTGNSAAVTISVAKRKGANATWISEDVIKRVEALKGKLIPDGVFVTVTRNYGETAKEKSDELLKHVLIATISVTILIALFLGLRASGVVAIAIPVTLALTILVFYLYGYTLNRVTLFALIFCIGILVDDAIVVVENIHRYFVSTNLLPMDAAIKAVDEVGNPTVLATFAVIVAILPLAFVSGLMGPYMGPIPIGASVAMVISLFIAFIISPWAAYRFLRGEAAGGKSHHDVEKEGYLTVLYRRIMTPLLEKRAVRYPFLAFVFLLLMGAMSLVYFKMVTVKMMPYDNKSELQVIVDMPEGTTLEETRSAATEVGGYLRTVPEVVNFQAYVGAASPYNFNGLVRHYFLREGGNVADIQVNLVGKDERKDQSHAIAKRLRGPIQEIGKKFRANIKIAEIPPGPPVLSTLVAEVYGPNEVERVGLAKKIKGIFEKTDGVVDTDWYVEDDQEKYRFVVDKEKAALYGISTEDVAKTLRVALNGASAGLAHLEGEKEAVDIMLRLPLADRSRIEALSSIYLQTSSGGTVPISQVLKIEKGIEDKTLYRKNLRSVTYVTGDVAGTEESPVYAIMKMGKEIEKIETPGGYKVEHYAARQPWMEDKLAMKWDGEWHITYEVFRDMGAAFVVSLILIYLLVVAWFRDFKIPFVIMAPIPLTLIGIFPGHAAFGAFFTATSMIGFIALAGIIVRNSIILIDFIHVRQGEGMPLKEAIIDAGAVRFRPMLLTGSAVMVGSFVILFDPIFQGLAISLMTGELASTLLSRIAIPVLYYMVMSGKEA